MKEKTFCGFIVRRECWTLTFRGKLAAIALILGMFLIVRQFIHPFLAMTERIPSEVLVVEGWTPAHSLREAATEFQNGRYQRLILVRPIVDGSDKYQSGRFGCDFMADLLIQYGVPIGEETTLFPVMAEKDRTFHSALAVQQWLSVQGMKVTSLGSSGKLVSGTRS